jgi:hypothetical protein
VFEEVHGVGTVGGDAMTVNDVPVDVNDTLAAERVA